MTYMAGSVERITGCCAKADAAAAATEPSPSVFSPLPSAAAVVQTLALPSSS